MYFVFLFRHSCIVTCDYTDDSKLYRIISNPCDTETLQQDLNYISNWSKLWLLNFNTTKCSVMHLGKWQGHLHTLFNLTTNSNTLLQPTLEQKDLEVWITPSNVWPSVCTITNQPAKQIKPWVWSNVILNACLKVFL